MDLRCASGILHGVFDEKSMTLEVTCRSNRCGKSPGIVVLHTIHLRTGEVDTETFRNTDQPKEVDQ